MWKGDASPWEEWSVMRKTTAVRGAQTLQWERQRLSGWWTVRMFWLTLLFKKTCPLDLEDGTSWALAIMGDIKLWRAIFPSWVLFGVIFTEHNLFFVFAFVFVFLFKHYQLQHWGSNICILICYWPAEIGHEIQSNFESRRYDQPSTSHWSIIERIRTQGRPQLSPNFHS